MEKPSYGHFFSQEKIDAAKNRILTPQEYLKMGHVPYPNYYVIRGKEKTVLFFMAIHTLNPLEPQFITLKNLIEDFKPQSGLVETVQFNTDHPERNRFVEKVTSLSYDECIKECGEPGFTVKMLLESGIKEKMIQSPEPLIQDLQKMHGAKGTSDDDLLLFGITRLLSQPHTSPDNFETRLATGARRKLKELGMAETENPGEYFQELFESMFGIRMSAENAKTFRYSVTPIAIDGNLPGKLNAISAYDSRLRDESIIDHAVALLEKSDRLLIVYGASHGSMLKPALEYLLSD